MSPSPVVITGATGFVGSHLVPALRNAGCPLLLLTNRRKMETEDPGIQQCDVSQNMQEAASLMQQLAPRGIIHLATHFMPSHTPEMIPEIIRSNITFGTELFDAAAKANVPWIINIGTFWQHWNGAPYDPVNLYAATKQALEDIGEFYRKTTSMRIVTLCLNDTYGTGDTRKKLFPLWKHLLEHPEERMAMSPGEQLMDILHVDDVVSGIIHLMQMLDHHAPEIADSDRFYLTAGECLSLRQIAGIFAEVAGQDLNISWGERLYRPREVMHPRCYGTPLPGWKSTISLRDGIRNFLAGK